MNPPILGIDFGTTNSVCAVVTANEPEVLPNDNEEKTTPSVVYYTTNNEQHQPLVGREAENKAEQNPQRVIRSIKRKMGEESTIEIAGESHRVEDVAGEILRTVRTNAAEALNVDRSQLDEAVITTPAYWESDRKQAVIQAANIAGFERVRTIKEPASAAVAYGQFRPGVNKLVGVYDLGGGTFDFAIVDVDTSQDTETGGKYNVIAQSGDPMLGGDDWDQKIVEWLSEKFQQRTGINPRENHSNDTSDVAAQIRTERLRSEAKKAKELLSNPLRDTVDIQLPFLIQHEETYEIDRELSQQKFEALTQNLVERTKEPIYKALEDASLSIENIDDVILVGGSTKMPQVKETVRAVFEQSPKDDVNPDEVVAAGAAVKGNRDDILLLEVTPLSLGIGLSGDKFKRMIPRNTRLPAQETEVFTTSSTGSTSVRIPIYQGEREIASENRHLKTLIIQGMTPGSTQSAHIEVTFEVQPNGLINVQAVESTRNKNVNVEIEGENRLSEEHIQEKVAEAREMEELDRKRKRIIEAQNEAKDAVSQAKRMLAEFPHVIEENERENIKQSIQQVQQTRGNNQATLGELREKTDTLNELILQIGDRARREGAKPKNVAGNAVTNGSGRGTEQANSNNSGMNTSTSNSTGASNVVTNSTQNSEATSDSKAENNTTDSATPSTHTDSTQNTGTDTTPSETTENEAVQETTVNIFQDDTEDSSAETEEETNTDIADGTEHFDVSTDTRGQQSDDNKENIQTNEKEDTNTNNGEIEIGLDEVSTERDTDIVRDKLAKDDANAETSKQDTTTTNNNGESANKNNSNTDTDADSEDRESQDDVDGDENDNVDTDADTDTDSDENNTQKEDTTTETQNTDGKQQSITDLTDIDY